MNAFKKRKSHDELVNQRLVLLAEDHPLNQKVAVLLLERMGFEVHVVSNGAAAVNASQRTIYDAILMDCHMPEVDGFAATRAIRQAEESNGLHVPIIAVTALAMAGDRERCLTAGMDDYITKPIDRDLLHQKLVYWMNPSVTAADDTQKVIRICEPAFSLSAEHQLQPIDMAQLYDAYDGDAPDLLVLFCRSSESLIEQMKSALESGNADESGKLAHELKGASWAIGAEEMARLSVFMEQAAAQQNWRVMHRTFIRLTHHFQQVKAFISKRVPKVHELKHM